MWCPSTGSLRRQGQRGRSLWRSAHLAVLTAGLLLGASCTTQSVGGEPTDAGLDAAALTRLGVTPPDRPNVDILFVVDNSFGMADIQEKLQQSVDWLFRRLQERGGGTPNLHVGVTSTDLGTGDYPYTYCDDPPWGDEGDLWTGTCPAPVDARYIVDVAPARSCPAVPNADGLCPSYDGSCSDNDCGHEPSTSLVVDPETGCPRCRNTGGQTPADTLRCISRLGPYGCSFEQPLEALRRALDPSNVTNAGFLRHWPWPETEGLLVIVIVTNEDDCSASTPELFDNTQTTLEDPLGPATSFRCFEFGVTCDVNDRTVEGLRHDCVSRDDPDALLYPVSRYEEFLRQLVNPDRLLVTAIAGPARDHTVHVGHDINGSPMVESACEGDLFAAPGIRLWEFVSSFHRPEDLDWAYGSACATSYVGFMSALADQILERLDSPCPPAPFRGCADPGAEFDAGPQDACTANDVCLPFCHVVDVFHRGLPDQTSAEVPPCLEVCPSGPCPGNADRTQAYAGGHPADRDPSLPVPACWHVAYREACGEAHGGDLRVARQTEPPARTHTYADCALLPAFEYLCSDGVDNDEDCLVDRDNPDCAQE